MPDETPAKSDSSGRRRWLAISSKFLAMLLILALVRLGWWWLRYPHAPNVKEAPLADCSAFMGSSEFNRMTHRDRTRFVMGTVDKLRDKSFSEIVALSMKGDPARKAAADNVKELTKDEQKQIGSAFLDLFLTKFYEQDASKRTAYLFGMVMMQKSGAAAATAKRLGLPTPEAFKKSLAGFVTDQPPHTQAELGQFMLDLSKEQRLLGAPRF
jgi:hypothetical protein